MKIDPEILVYPYAPGAVLGVAGADAATFLQGQFTNDLSKLAPGGSAYGLWLDRKGRVLADSTVVRRRDEPGFWIVSVDSPGSTLGEHLAGHVIADEVDIQVETEAWAGVALLGSGSGEVLAAAGPPGFFFPGRRGGGESWEWIYPRSAADAARALLAGRRAVPARDLELRRIRAVIPRVPADIGPADLPNEGGLDATAISYSKGCYLGQEVMARVKALGRVRRALVRVTGPGSPVPPAALWLGTVPAGELRTVAAGPAGFEGLALVPVGAAAAGAALAWECGGPAVVAVHPP
jgi:folate-binding protein YgfZ